jgi:hypothetical protein
MKLLVMQFSPFTRHLIPLRSKYPPQHPVLKHPQSMFFPFLYEYIHIKKEVSLPHPVYTFGFPTDRVYSLAFLLAPFSFSKRPQEDISKWAAIHFSPMPRIAILLYVVRHAVLLLKPNVPAVMQIT